MVKRKLKADRKRNRGGIYKTRRIVPKAKKGYLRTGGYYNKLNEVKFHDTIMNNGFLNTGYNYGSLNLIPQGAGQSERVGRKVVIKEIDIKGYTIMNSSNVEQTNEYLIAVVLDTQANGANASWGDIYNDGTLYNPGAGPYVGGADLSGMRNMSNSERFRVLKVMKFTYNAQVRSDLGIAQLYGETTKQMNWFKRCSIPIEFSGATGAITEVRSNNIFITGLSNITENYGLHLYCRVKYSDS